MLVVVNSYAGTQSDVRRLLIRLRAAFGTITSTTGRRNASAPVQFVTTGIFERLAKDNSLDPACERVIIDEAHVTIEQSPGVELGIALARARGVTIDYMSATVDTRTLADDLQISTIIRADQQRFAVWKHNLLVPLVDGIIETVQHIPQLPVLTLASEVIRNVQRESAFRRQLADIESANRNYVILATSVVEMGITFPTLDFVVTMDSGYDQETIGDVTFPVVAPLGVNSLYQRIGRVGRRRPGIAYISRDVGAT